MKIIATRSEKVEVADRDIIEAAIKIVQRESRLNSTRWVNEEGYITLEHGGGAHTWTETKEKASERELRADQTIKHLAGLLNLLD